ncbi:phosphofurin acidic cluster sorting protein 2 isoform X2 [Eupeodes corollae]|uniref:phosphofurin acidic cluster sorting protein 2 isoform X2 n=1 Tax=Eupeodes corollae TaxID=290404 RepID=UPI002492E849|nr:phosphofurin acidic cluster sorting protein 2 isoform X2 [Eupeodes corollae]
MRLSTNTTPSNMAEKSSKLEKLSSSSNMNVGGSNTGGSGGGGGSSSGKPVPMKLFAAWEVDRTPPNCIPRLCSLTITRLSILTPLPGDMTSLSLAVKMQSSKRTLRSHEIPITQNLSGSQLGNNVSGGGGGSGGAGGGASAQQHQHQHQHQQQQQGNNQMNSMGGGGGGGSSGGAIGSGSGPGGGSGQINSSHHGLSNNGGLGCGGGNSNSSSGCNLGNMNNIMGIPLAEAELDLHFSLQYPHFIKRDGNRLVILLQRRKKYKSRTILGYKTLAEGIIRMDAVLQKSMDMTVELIASGKNGRPGTTVASLRAERVSSIPVDHDNKNNNSVMLADRVAEYSDEDEEGEFSSGEFNDDGTDLGITGYDPKRDYAQSKHDMRKYRKLQRSEVEDVALGTNPVDSDSEFEMKDKSSSRAKISRTISLQQRNFKQKIVALLKRFKVSEELDGGVTRGPSSLRGERDLDALFQELESLSCCEGDDSGPDMDSLSIGSTPKPSLRPFFTNSRIMLHDSNTDRCPEFRNDSSGNEANAGNTDGQTSDPQNSPPREKDFLQNAFNMTPVTPGPPVTVLSQPPPPSEKRSRLFRTSSSTPGGGKKKQSLSLTAEPRSVLETCLSPTNVEPRKMLLDQLSRVFATDEAVIPDVVTIISPPEALVSISWASKLTQLFANTFKPAFLPQNTAEVKAVLQALMGKIQKYCNSNAKPPTTVKILLLGGDWLQGAALRHYVELLGVRPPDWVNHLRFYIVPIGSSTISRHLSSVDQSYCAMFGTEHWYQLCERAAATAAAVTAVSTVNAQSISSSLNDPMAMNKSDIVELINRVQRYLHAAGPCTQIPIAEAMVNYKDEDSCQIFVPFVSDVRIGYADGPQVSLDLEESLQLAQQAAAGNAGGNSGTGILSSSPPLSGRVSPPLQTPPSNQTTAASAHESVELQVDYWPIMRPLDAKEKSISKGGDQGKNSIKSTFRNLQVWRLPQNAQIGEISNGLTVSFATKEKKQKIMRLGKKKEKDRDLEKEQCVEGVARLICSPKQSHPVPLRVYIDGTEWTGVKFFQLSSQWQTHVKNFPVALIGYTPMSCSELS